MKIISFLLSSITFLCDVKSSTLLFTSTLCINFIPCTSNEPEYISLYIFYISSLVCFLHQGKLVNWVVKNVEKFLLKLKMLHFFFFYSAQKSTSCCFCFHIFHHFLHLFSSNFFCVFFCYFLELLSAY